MDRIPRLPFRPVVFHPRFSGSPAKVLWRLRNRLIVTYVFIGVIPAVLLVGMALITLYGLAGQGTSLTLPVFVKGRFRDIVRERDRLDLRVCSSLQLATNKLTVVAERILYAGKKSLHGKFAANPSVTRHGLFVRKVCTRSRLQDVWHVAQRWTPAGNFKIGAE
jgi:hypothetical protein